MKDGNTTELACGLIIYCVSQHALRLGYLEFLLERLDPCKSQIRLRNDYWNWVGGRSLLAEKRPKNIGIQTLVIYD